MSELPFAATTPVSVARVGLKARDARRVADFYKTILGLTETRNEGSVIGLSAGSREILEIEGSDALKPDDPRSAGLYHTAFLLPSRADLARWVRMATNEGLKIDGASDHLVSEAVYLADPEGNGIEIYADRPKESWSYDGASIRMTTERLNFPSLLSELDGVSPNWHGAPEGTVVGHVHLRVGDVDRAESFWNSELGFDTMTHYGNAAVFLSSGGYHHHIGANVWQSRGAGPRDPDRTGLSFVELAAKDPAAAKELVDPWGSAVRVITA